MRKNSLVLFLLIGLVVISNQNIFAKAGAIFLRTGVGAKGMGLGQAYGSIVKDPSALYWNPAGLANINGQTDQVSRLNITKESEDSFDNEDLDRNLDGDLGHTKKHKSNKQNDKKQADTETVYTFEFQSTVAYTSLSEGRNIGFAGVGFTALGGTVGLGFLGTMIGGIDGYDENGTALGTIQYQAFAGYAGYAYQKGASRIGFSVTGLQESIAGETINGGALNVGIQSVPLAFISIGMDIQNLAGVIQKSTASKSVFEKLDTILRFSIAVSSFPPNQNLLVVFGFASNLDDLDSNEGFQPRVGLGYLVTSSLYVMAGINNGAVSFGLGVAQKSIKVYASVNQDPFTSVLQYSAEATVTF